MMKIIFLVLLVCTFSINPSLAQPPAGGSVEDMLSASLGGLKESYQKLVGQNSILKSQIETYRNGTPSLRKQLDSLVSREKDLLVTVKSQTSADQVPTNVYRRQIEALKQKIGAVSEQTLEKTLGQERKQLQISLEESKNNLRAVHAEMQKIKEESAEALTQINQLKAKRLNLERQLSARQAAWEKDAAKAYAQGLEREVSQLKLRRLKLERNLSAQEEPEEDNISQSTEEIFQLRRKFTALEYENLYLKKELSRYRAGN